MYHPRLKGNHYDMGKHYGEIMFKNGIDLSNTIKLNDEQIIFCSKCFEIYEKYAPCIMDEVRGLADGLHLQYRDLANWLISLYCFESDHGCSVFAVNCKGSTYFGRNMDMFSEYKKTSESILYIPNEKNIFLGHSTAMILMEDGINQYGLAVALTFILPKEIKPGLNGGLIVRLILEECKNVEEAIELVNKLPISSSHNIVLADKSGSLAIIELTSSKVKIIRNNMHVIATNHFTDEEMLNYNGEENWYYTNNRYDSIKKALNNENIDFNYVKDILKGRFGFVCQYEKKLHFETIWSVVYNLNNLDIEIVEGNPSKAEFKGDNRLKYGINKEKNKYGKILSN